jgi:hypothetical protein
MGKACTTIGEMRNSYRVLMGKSEEKKPLGRPRRRRLDNNEMDVRQIGWGVIDWIHMAQDREERRALVNTEMDLQVS